MSKWRLKPDGKDWVLYPPGEPEKYRFVKAYIRDFNEVMMVVCHIVKTEGQNYDRIA